VNFTLKEDPGSISGTVKDEVGNPLPSTVIELNYNNIVVYSTLTASDGKYKILGVAPGDYIVHAHSTGYFLGLAEISIRSEEELTQDFTLTQLSDNLSFNGLVYDFDTDDLIQGAYLLLYIEYQSKIVYIDTIVSSSNGAYQFAGLSAGNYILNARLLDYFPETSKVINPSATYNFVLKRILPSPRDLIGEVKVDKFLTQADRVHVLKWKPSLIPYVESYNIYRNGSFIGNVSKNTILEYQDHKRNRHQSDSYRVYSVSKKGREVGFSEVSLK
jgi:hypothetical protein